MTRLCASVAERHSKAAVIVPPRTTAVLSGIAESAHTQRDRHLQHIAQQCRGTWQKASGNTTRARAEAAIDRFNYSIGERRRARTDDLWATEVDVAVHALRPMLELGRPSYARTA